MLWRILRKLVLLASLVWRLSMEPRLESAAQHLFGRVSQGTLTKAIKSVIARQAEVKYVASTYEDQEQVATT